MMARFLDGPYDQVTLQLNETLEHVLLPVKITTGIAIVEEKVFYAQARYRLTVYNDVEARYQFEGINKP